MANIIERSGRIVIAIIKAPISIPGERRHILSSMFTKFCSCVTSFVRRVTREPVENLSIFAKEYFCTLAKTSFLRSAAKLTDAFAPK